jgi:hypothetical protein
MGLSFSGIANTAKTKDPPWIAKDWTQWNIDDCNAVLKSSPWGERPNSAGESSTSGPMVSSSAETIVQLRSALPIRQALLRKLQLDESYSRMNPEKKQAFDQAHAHDLDPPDRILIYIENGASTTLPPAGSGSLISPTSASTARQAALLRSDNDLVLPIAVTMLKKSDEYGNYIQYSFPRSLAGKPVYSANDPRLVIELGAPLSLDKKIGNFDQPLPFQDSRMRIRFKFEDLIYKGKLEY